MTGRFGRFLCLVSFAMFQSAPVHAERLALNFLPPDFQPSNICALKQEDTEEALEAEATGGTTELEDEERLKFISQDIRRLTRDDPNRWFDFIEDLIDWQAELDPEFTDIQQAFARIDLYLAAARVDDLQERGLIDGLTLRADDLSNAERVRLARHYLTGQGVAPDQTRAEQLLVVAAFAGNANALLELLRIQLRGVVVDGWDLPAEQTAQLAFGGLIGQINRGLCGRAERMAREYTDGDLLKPNLELAFAWRKFAADMGGAEASWRMVEHHLSATGQLKDNAALDRYLAQALEGNFVIERSDIETLIEAGASTESEVRRLLKFNHNHVGKSGRRSAVPFLELDVALVEDGVNGESEWLTYLKEVTARPDVPPAILIAYARELELRFGQWAVAPEIIEILGNAVSQDDPGAMTKLAAVLIGTGRNDPQIVARAEALLTGAVTRHGHVPAIKALTDMYRCRLPASPMLNEVDYWSQIYADADQAPIRASGNDLAKYHPTSEPEAIALMQTLGLRGHGGSRANFLQYLQSDPAVPDATLRFWARSVASNDVAIETYAKHEYALALTPAEAENAVELFRRVYLQVGAASGIDLAVVLTRHDSRDPEVVEDIRTLLSASINRGEGAAMRLMQRLTGREPGETYAEYAPIIEQRGDFLAHMVAAPFVDGPTFDRYMDRAIAMMSCSTKDVAEVADAYASQNRAEDVQHWTNVGRAMEYGHTLSKLTISDYKVDVFERGNATTDTGNEVRALQDNDERAMRRLYLLAADIGGQNFDPEQAAAYLVTMIQGDNVGDVRWALDRYRSADRQVRRQVDARLDMRAAYVAAAEQGVTSAQFDLGMLLRTDAVERADLAASATWLLRAAEAGHTEAMVEYARALGLGLGLEADPEFALIWLQKAESLDERDARPLITLLTAMTAQE